MNKGFIIFFAKMVLIIAIAFIFFMAYIGFIYSFLDGVIPKLTSVYSTISFMVGGVAGIRIVDL